MVLTVRSHRRPEKLPTAWLWRNPNALQSAPSLLRAIECDGSMRRPQIRPIKQIFVVRGIALELMYAKYLGM